MIDVIKLYEEYDDTFPVSFIVPLSVKRNDFFYNFVFPLLEANRPAEIIINSNLCVQDQFIDRLIAVGNDLIVNNKVKRFEIYTSIESFDEQAEYIRYGMNFKQFIDNLNKVVTQIPMIAWKSKVVIMVTYNILSIPKFRKLLQFYQILHTLRGDLNRQLRV